MGRTHLCSVAEERRISIVLFYRLSIEVNSSGPVMLRKSLITLHLQRSGSLDVWGSHGRRTEGGRLGGGGGCRRLHTTAMGRGVVNSSVTRSRKAPLQLYKNCEQRRESPRRIIKKPEWREKLAGSLVGSAECSLYTYFFPSVVRPSCSPNLPIHAPIGLAPFENNRPLSSASSATFPCFIDSLSLSTTALFLLHQTPEF